MRSVEAVLEALELAQTELVAAYPGDFQSLDRLARNRASVIDELLELMEDPGLTADQLDKLKRIYLGGILAVERIRGERQIVREELSLLSQQGRVLSGYRHGSAQD